MSISHFESRIKSEPFNPLHHIALARAYLEEGDEERARKIVAIKRRLPSKDPSVHYDWGKLCEELGLARQARESYEQAVALNPNNSDYHFRLALLYQESGAWERTIKHLRKTISLSPNRHQAKEMLALLYEEMELQGASIAVQGRLRNKTPSTILSHPEISEEDVRLILDLFKGREFGFALNNMNTAGVAYSTFVKGTLGHEEIRSHLMGKETYGVYPLRTDRTLKFALIHIAPPWRKVLEHLRDKGYLAITEGKIHQYAKGIIETARRYEIPGYLEDAGQRDRRIWFFFEEFIPIELAERFLNTLLDKVPAPPSESTLMLCLGLQGKGIGYEDQSIMLPLGINPKTAKRCFFVDDYGTPYDDQLLWVRKFRLLRRNDIQSFIMSLERGRYEWESMGSTPLEQLKKGCSVIEEIIRKAQSGRMLHQDEKMVLFFTVGLFNDGFKALHRVLEPCPDYRPKKVDWLGSRLKSNPISCPKIRQLLPEMTAYLPCNCSFEVPVGKYPTPLLHISSGVVPAIGNISDERENVIDYPVSVNEVERRYQLVCQEIERLIKEKEELELSLRRCTLTNR